MDADLAVRLCTQTQPRRLALGLRLVRLLQCLFVLSHELLQVDLGANLLARALALQLQLLDRRRRNLGWTLRKERDLAFRRLTLVMLRRAVVEVVVLQARNSLDGTLTPRLAEKIDVGFRALVCEFEGWWVRLGAHLRGLFGISDRLLVVASEARGALRRLIVQSDFLRDDVSALLAIRCVHSLWLLRLGVFGDLVDVQGQSADCVVELAPVLLAKPPHLVVDHSVVHRGVSAELVHIGHALAPSKAPLR